MASGSRRCALQLSRQRFERDAQFLQAQLDPRLDGSQRDAGVSGDTIRNYIALTQLVPELQQMVDEKKIAFNPAVETSCL